MNLDIEKITGQLGYKESWKMESVVSFSILLFAHCEFARYIPYTVYPLMDLSTAY